MRFASSVLSAGCRRASWVFRRYDFSAFSAGARAASEYSDDASGLLLAHRTRVQDYHTLRVWQKGQDMAVAVDRLVVTFPRRGFASIKDQPIRSAESIPTNVVEGCGSSTAPDFAPYLEYSIKSCCELEHHIESAERIDLLTASQRDHFTAAIVLIRKMTVSFRRCVLRDWPPHHGK
jgi:four helix bundle protein